MQTQTPHRAGQQAVGPDSGLRGPGRLGKAGEVEHTSALHKQETCWLLPPNSNLSFHDRDLVPTSQLAARGALPPTLLLGTRSWDSPGGGPSQATPLNPDTAGGAGGPAVTLQGLQGQGSPWQPAPGRSVSGGLGGQARVHLGPLHNGTLGQAVQTKPDEAVAFQCSLCVCGFLFSPTARTGSVSRCLFPFRDQGRGASRSPPRSLPATLSRISLADSTSPMLLKRLRSSSCVMFCGR